MPHPPVATAATDFWSSWEDIIKPVAAALFGGWFGYLLRGIEGQKAETMARVEDACAEVALIQSVSGKYWSRQTKDLPTSAECIEQEGEISGRLHSLNIGITSLLEFMPTKYHAELKSNIIEFRKSTTSGSFADALGHDASGRTVNGC